VASPATVGGSPGENSILACRMRRDGIFDVVFFLKRYLGDPSIRLYDFSGIRRFRHQVSKNMRDVIVWCCVKILQGRNWSEEEI
jgi:hypothetical protein